MNKDSTQRRNDRKEMADMVFRKPEHVSENAKKVVYGKAISTKNTGREEEK